MLRNESRSPIPFVSTRCLHRLHRRAFTSDRRENEQVHNSSFFSTSLRSSMVISGLSSIWWRWEIRMPPTICTLLHFDCSDVEEEKEWFASGRPFRLMAPKRCRWQSLDDRWWITKYTINDPATTLRLSRNFSSLSVVVVVVVSGWFVYTIYLFFFLPFQSHH